MSTSAYPVGEDCMWLGVDEFGYVGAFFTGGSGPVPDVCLESADELLRSAETLICGLPRHTEARLRVTLPRPDDFITVAERGIYAFDWTDVHRSRLDEIEAYELVATPLDPITIDQLPLEVSQIVNKVRLAGADFASAVELDVMARVPSTKQSD
jgi:hypothetical protein